MIKVDCLQPVETSLPNTMSAYYFRDDQSTYINKENVLYATTHVGLVITVDEDGNEVKNELTELIDFTFSGGSVVTTRMDCIGVMALLRTDDVQVKMEVPEETENSVLLNKFLNDIQVSSDKKDCVCDIK